MGADYIEYFYAAYSEYRDSAYNGNYFPDLTCSPGNSFFVFDLDEDKCKYFCSRIKSITGRNYNDYLFKGIMFFKNLIHPDDYSELISELLTYIFLCREKKYYGNKNSRIKELFCRIRHKHQYWVNTRIFVLYTGKSFDSKSNMLIGVIHKNEEKQGRMEILDPYYAISSREREVLQLIGNGDSSKIIADKLHISETTAISHRKNLIQKLDVKNTAELIKKAVKEKIIE